VLIYLLGLGFPTDRRADVAESQEKPAGPLGKPK
jgi:hypothetical protein